MIKAMPAAWHSPEGDSARAIRMKVFVEEQCVPEDAELDEHDLHAFHVLAVDDELGAVGTGRLFHLPQEPFTGRIGRMAVLKEARGRGVGAAMLVALMREGLRRGYEQLVLDSQVQAIDFYAKFGFEVCGPEHLDCGIVHRLMRTTRSKAADVIRHAPR